MKQTKTNLNEVKIGLYSIGLDTYWDQFDGLFERLLGYHNTIKNKMEEKDTTKIIDGGLVDTPEKAQLVASLFKENDVSIIFLYISTYALSSTVLPVVQKAKVPVILLNLQPKNAIDYEAFNKLGDRGLMTGEWLANCQACSVPEIACVFNRADIDYDIISGTLQDEKAWSVINDWIEAAGVFEIMRHNRVGILGHYYGGMLDVYTDVAKQSATFGTHFEQLEMCEIQKYISELTDDEIKIKINQFNSEFDVTNECEIVEITRAAKTSCALDKMISHHDLGSYAYYYEGENGNAYENIVTSIIPGNTLLTKQGIPVAGECEIKNVQAMKILDAFGAGGSFSEFYGLDFNDDIVMLGHDGPGHATIAQEKVKLVPLPLFHGKPGKGLSIQMNVKHGPVTILSVIEHKDGTIKFLVAQGESVEGPVLQIGNTNSRYKFSIGAKEFIESWSKAGPSHHCAIGIGHLANKLKKLSRLFKIEMIKIC